MLQAADLLAGAEGQADVEIPERFLPTDTEDRRVRVRALTVRDLRLITRAARDNEDLTGALMVRQALIEPTLSIDEVEALPAGILQLLLREVNRVSGIVASEQEVLAELEDPLVKASVLLSTELGWTTEEVGQLTMGEAMLHVAALRSRG